jgi:hypothetical protein
MLDSLWGFGFWESWQRTWGSFLVVWMLVLFPLHIQLCKGQYRCCNFQRALMDRWRSRVRFPVGSNKNLWRQYLLQWASNIKSPSKRNGLLQIVHHLHLIECYLITPWCNWETGITFTKSRKCYTKNKLRIFNKIKECKHIRQTKCTSTYIIIALLHSSLFISDWRRQIGGLLVKTYRHGISELFLKVVLNTKKKQKPTKPFVTYHSPFCVCHKPGPTKSNTKGALYFEIELTYRPV